MNLTFMLSEPCEVWKSVRILFSSGRLIMAVGHFMMLTSLYV